MKKKPEFSNFGFSTILLCFVMICVVTFSALSLVSAYSDFKLSQKVADKNRDYYTAQESAYETLAAIDALAVTSYKNTTSSALYYQALQEDLSRYGTITEDNGTLLLSFTETIAEEHFLKITLQIDYPTNDNDSFVRVLEWRSYYEKTEPEDDFLDLIN